jgi:hypothetical protein
MHGGKAAASFSLNSIPLYVEARGIRLVAPNPNTCRRRQSLWRRLGVLKSEPRWRSLGRRLTWRGCRGQARGRGDSTASVMKRRRCGRGGGERERKWRKEEVERRSMRRSFPSWVKQSLRLPTPGAEEELFNSILFQLFL